MEPEWPRQWYKTAMGYYFFSGLSFGIGWGGGVLINFGIGDWKAALLIVAATSSLGLLQLIKASRIVKRVDELLDEEEDEEDD